MGVFNRYRRRHRSPGEPKTPGEPNSSIPLHSRKPLLHALPKRITTALKENEREDEVSNKYENEGDDNRTRS